LFAASALLTSAAVRLYAASWSGSSQARIAKSFAAKDVGRLHAFDRLQLGLHDADQVVGDLVGWKNVAREADIHRCDRLPDLDR